MAQAQNPNQPIFQIFLPSIYRGASPDVETNDDLDGRDNATTSQISAPASPNASSSTSGSFPLLNNAPGRHYLYEIFVFGLFCSTIPMHFMAFEYFARNARLASFSAATPTFLSKFYTFWASVFLGIGVAGFLLLCDFLNELPAALSQKDQKWYEHNFSVFNPNIVTIGEDLAIAGKGIVLWKVWGLTLEGLLFFCIKKELSVSWTLGCHCQSYIGIILWAFGILRYASFAVILFHIWVMFIIEFIAEILSPISSYHTRARQMVEICFLISSVVIAAATIS